MEELLEQVLESDDSDLDDDLDDLCMEDEFSNLLMVKIEALRKS